MLNKLQNFIEKVKGKVKVKKDKFKMFIQTLQREKPTKTLSRRIKKGISGLMEILTSKVKEYTARGGSKSRKNRKIYMNKYTRRNGIHPTNKRKSRNNNRYTKNPRKTIKK